MGWRYTRLDQAVGAFAQIDDLASTCRRLRQRPQHATRSFKLGGIDQPHPRRTIHDAAPGVSNLRIGIAQRRRHLIRQIIELLMLHRRGVDLEQELRAAAQVEAEIDGLAWQHVWDAFAQPLRHEVRERKHKPHHGHYRNQDNSPPRDLKHEV